MIPVSPVMPGSEEIENVLAKNQPEYLPLPVVFLDTVSRPAISRWRLTDEERQKIASGADIVLTQCIFNDLYHPVSLQVVFPEEHPFLGE